MSPLAEYEVFQYKNADEPTLTITEAMAAAARQRLNDASHVYRIMPVDGEMSGFRVVKIPLQQAYAETWSKLLKHVYQIGALRLAAKH